MDQGLFRKEVIEARRGTWLGTIQVAVPLSRWAITLLFLTLAGAILAFLVYGHYTRRSRVTGQLVPTEGLLAVRANIQGLVGKVRVHEGERVQQGQALLEIGANTDSSALGDVHADISKRLRAQREGLQSDLSTQRESNREQMRQLRHRLGLLRAQRKQIRDQHALQQKRVSSDRKLLQRIQPMGRKGYVSAFRIEQQQAQLLRDQTRAKDLVRQQLGVEQQIGDARHKLSELPLDLKTRSNATDRQVNEIDQKLAQNEAQRSLILRAPRSGVITTLLAKPGQPVSVGQSLLSILPQGSHLQAQLLVTSRAIGFIAPGNRVVLRYQAYPYQKFGQQYGKIDTISRSALSPAEVVEMTGQRSKQPLYRVDVKLDRQDMLAYGQSQPLKPGMTLDADILMDRRSLLEWVFEPLYGLGRHVFGTEVGHGGR